jgi:molybdenum cofactor cytidylyltransferase
MSKSPVGILLAAGKSQRFGSNKLLHPVIDNTPMLIVCAEKLASVLPGSVVVIHRDLSELTAQLEQLGLCVVINKQAEQGMGSSIACGVRASSDATGWLIMLADMPYIKTETLSALANKLKQGAEIVAPLFGQKLGQQRGHPVGFSQRFKNDLMALNEDIGARHIIEKYQQHQVMLPVDDEGVLRDIDLPEDVVR